MNFTNIHEFSRIFMNFQGGVFTGDGITFFLCLVERERERENKNVAEYSQEDPKSTNGAVASTWWSTTSHPSAPRNFTAGITVSRPVPSRRQSGQRVYTALSKALEFVARAARSATFKLPLPRYLYSPWCRSTPQIVHTPWGRGLWRPHSFLQRIRYRV